MLSRNSAHRLWRTYSQYRGAAIGVPNERGTNEVADAAAIVRLGLNVPSTIQSVLWSTELEHADNL